MQLPLPLGFSGLMFAPQTLSFNPLSRMPLGMGNVIVAQRPRGINSHESYSVILIMRNQLVLGGSSSSSP